MQALVAPQLRPFAVSSLLCRIRIKLPLCSQLSSAASYFAKAAFSDADLSSLFPPLANAHVQVALQPAPVPWTSSARFRPLSQSATVVGAVFFC